MALRLCCWLWLYLNPLSYRKYEKNSCDALNSYYFSSKGRYWYRFIILVTRDQILALHFGQVNIMIHYMYLGNCLYGQFNFVKEGLLATNFFMINLNFQEYSVRYFYQKKIVITRASKKLINAKSNLANFI